MGLERVFGARLPEIPLVTLTPFVGQLFSGAGAIAMAVGAKAVPPAIEPHGIGAEAHAAALRKAGAARLVADLDVVAGLLAG